MMNMMIMLTLLFLFNVVGLLHIDFLQYSHSLNVSREFCENFTGTPCRETESAGGSKKIPEYNSSLEVIIEALTTEFYDVMCTTDSRIVITSRYYFLDQIRVRRYYLFDKLSRKLTLSF